MGKRTHKSILNAEVGLVFYFATLILAFFSRKIFLDCLGADFIGLVGTLGSILGFLNLSELGIGLSISYFLFKPLASHDEKTICEIMSLIGFLYKRIGLFIICAGTIVSLFFPLIFANTELPFTIIYFAFFSFLGSSAIGYFINYRQILLDADQKLYLVNAYFNSFGIFKSITQIAIALFYKNLYLWVVIEFGFGILQCIILNWKINKEYPWLNTTKKHGKEILQKYPDVIIKTKQIVIHQLKDFLLTKSDEILIFSFVSLKMVAYYGNYVMVIGKLSTLVMTFYAGTGTGVGNLVAESKLSHIISVYWQLTTLRFFTAGILVYSLAFLINPFIEWWLGSEYVLSGFIIFLLFVNLFIMQTRATNDIFNHAYGLYGDVWSAWVELFLNLSITFCIAFNYGLAGILLGKIGSLFAIAILWKPYYLFSSGFHIPVSTYWKGYFRNLIPFILALLFMIVSIDLFNLNPKPSLISMLYFGIKAILPTILLYGLLLYLIAPESKKLIHRLPFIKQKAR